jgi:hypothetical protein
MAASLITSWTVPSQSPSLDEKTILKVVFLGEGPNCESNYTMSFLVPSLLQDSAPAPTDASVYLESRNEFRVVAKQFPGIPGDLDFTIQAAELYGLATEAGIQVYRHQSFM